MTTKKNNDKRKVAIAVLAGLAITGLVGASAASLNGISNQGLGADAEIVGSCDIDGVTVAYNTSYDTNEVVHVDSATIGAVNLACDSLTYEVQLYTTDDITNVDTVIAEVTGTVVLDTLLALDPLDDFDVDLTGANVDAERVEGIAITISGNS